MYIFVYFYILYLDINECATNNGGCDHKCQNYDGGHYCSCNTGYRLASDGTTCEGAVRNIIILRSSFRNLEILCVLLIVASDLPVILMRL